MYQRMMECILDLQADTGHLEGTKAILRGFKTRFQKTGPVAPILIHTVSSTSENLVMKLSPLHYLSSLAPVS